MMARHRTGKNIGSWAVSGQGAGGQVGQGEDVVRIEPEIENADDADRECGSQGPGQGGGGSCGLALAHVHGDDRPQIVIDGDHAVEYGDDSKPDEVRVDGGAEEIELAQEAGRDWETSER